MIKLSCFANTEDVANNQMTLRITITFAILFPFFVGCLRVNGTNDKTGKIPTNVSRVEYFRYGGYSDTIYALIYGQVYEKENAGKEQDTLVALSDVGIRVEQNGKSTATNSTGEFQIGLEKGVFSLVISKEGYEPIQLANYVSDPDQVSSMKIILVKGKEQRTFEIPKWTK